MEISNGKYSVTALKTTVMLLMIMLGTGFLVNLGINKYYGAHNSYAIETGRLIKDIKKMRGYYDEYVRPQAIDTIAAHCKLLSHKITKGEEITNARIHEFCFETPVQDFRTYFDIIGVDAGEWEAIEAVYQSQSMIDKMVARQSIYDSMREVRK